MLKERVRLHVIGGKTRLECGEDADAVAAFYDAVSSAMQMYTYPELSYRIHAEDDKIARSDDRILFEVLKKSDIIDDSITDNDFDYIEKTLDDALENRMSKFDSKKFLDITERLLAQLMKNV
jgi:hypothetical protein